MPGYELIDRPRRALLGVAGVLACATALRPWSVLAQATASAKVPIGIIGSGHICGTIGRLWVKANHPVLFSSRHPDELKDLAAGLGPLAHTGTVEQATAFSDVLLLAVPYAALPQIGRDYGDALKGKIVLDACNAVAARDGAPISDEVERDGVGITSLNYLIFAKEANRPDPKLAVPIAGDDPEAVRMVTGLVRDAGFDPVVVGNLADARRFQRGAPGYGQSVSASELKQKLSLSP